MNRRRGWKTSKLPLVLSWVPKRFFWRGIGARLRARETCGAGARFANFYKRRTLAVGFSRNELDEKANEHVNHFLCSEDIDLISKNQNLEDIQETWKPHLLVEYCMAGATSCPGVWIHF